MLAFIFGTDSTGWWTLFFVSIIFLVVVLGFFLPRDARKQEHKLAKAKGYVDPQVRKLRNDVIVLDAALTAAEESGYVDPEVRKLRNDVIVLDTALTAAEESLAEIHLLLHKREPLTLYRVQQLHEDVHAKLRVNGIDWEEAQL